MHIENKNLLQPTKFTLTFPDLPDMVYFCQKANIPGAVVSEVPRQVPNIDLYTPGTRLAYGTFDVTYLVNENLSSWRVIHDWLRDNTIDQKYKYEKRDAILTVMSNMNNPKIRIKFINVFPISVGDMEFDSTLSAEEHVVTSASFRFDYYDVEVL